MIFSVFKALDFVRRTVYGDTLRVFRGFLYSSKLPCLNFDSYINAVKQWIRVLKHLRTMGKESNTIAGEIEVVSESLLACGFDSAYSLAKLSTPLREKLQPFFLTTVARHINLFLRRHCPMSSTRWQHQ
jgi:hypothetical protein